MTLESGTQRLRTLRRAIAGRRVYWFGVRGEDSEPLLAFPEFSGSFSLTSPLSGTSISNDTDVVLETLAGERGTLGRHDIEGADSAAIVEFRTRTATAARAGGVVMTYQPAAFLSALSQAKDAALTLAGPLRQRQAAFEYKPWVESSLTRRGIRTPGWNYVNSRQRGSVQRMLIKGPLVLRASANSGGVGIAKLSTKEDLESRWLEEAEWPLAVAPFIDRSVPVNLSGCVFGDGTVRLHPASVQLIGVSSCTEREFGYCGNDFGAAAGLSSGVLRILDALGRDVGAWLHEHQYLGAFGVDALVRGGDVYFVEVNPRFQGSSSVSALIADHLDVPNLFLDHLSAFLGVPPGDGGFDLAQWARHQPAVSQLFVHNVDQQTYRLLPDLTAHSGEPGTRVSQLPPRVPVLPGGVLFRVRVPRSVTGTGYEIDDAMRVLVDELRRAFAPTTRPGAPG